MSMSRIARGGAHSLENAKGNQALLPFAICKWIPYLSAGVKHRLVHPLTAAASRCVAENALSNNLQDRSVILGWPESLEPIF